MKKYVIAFSGKVGSGKTTLSTQLSHILKWEWVSFGNFIRTLAMQKNLGDDRKTLQDLGLQLLEQDLEAFCKGVLDQIQWQNSSFIIDGVRHKEVLEFLKQTVKPIPLFHIHVMVDYDLQKERIEKRVSEKLSIDDIENHSTEFQIKQILPDSADLILNPTLTMDQSIEKIMFFIGRK